MSVFMYVNTISFGIWLMEEVKNDGNITSSKASICNWFDKQKWQNIIPGGFLLRQSR